jgi:hypothetical protein
MRYSPSHSGTAFCKSVMIGAFSGICVQLVLTTWGEPIKASEVWAIPVIIAAYGLLAVPFVGLGLALFGLPATSLLRAQANRKWVGFIAILWGAIAGKLVFYAIDHVIFFGYYDLRTIGAVDPGVIYGIPTAVAWWLFQRRAFAAG